MKYYHYVPVGQKPFASPEDLTELDLTLSDMVEMVCNGETIIKAKDIDAAIEAADTTWYHK